MASDGALLTAKFEDGRLELAAGGSWTAPHAAELETLVDRVAADAGRAKAVSIDMRGCANSTRSAPGCLSVSRGNGGAPEPPRRGRHAGARPDPAQGDEQRETSSRSPAGAAQPHRLGSPPWGAGRRASGATSAPSPTCSAPSALPRFACSPARATFASPRPSISSIASAGRPSPSSCSSPF